MKEPLSPEFVAWLRVFTGWLKRASGEGIERPLEPLLTYERWIEQPKRKLEAKLSLLNDLDFKRPGAVASWNLVNHSFPDAGVMISLDNLYKLAIEIPKGKKEIILQGLERSKTLTHRFHVSWVWKSRHQRRFRYTLIDAFDIDLASPFIDEAAREIVRYTALAAYEMKEIPSMSWQERIYNFPWLQTIQDLAPRQGCNGSHRYRHLCKRVQKVSG